MNNIHPILKNMLPLVDGIAQAFGKNCEVVLHDVKNPEKSIVAIANGHVTERAIGNSMSEYSVEKLKKGVFDKKVLLGKKKTSDGRILKSASMYIKDENDDLIGVMCINYDISQMLVLKNDFDEFLSINENQDFIEEVHPSENNINDVLVSIVNSTIDAYGKPVVFINKEEKVSIVELLDQKGVFLVKGAVDYVAKVLCVSRYTIYNYLDEIRVFPSKE